MKVPGEPRERVKVTRGYLEAYMGIQQAVGRAEEAEELAKVYRLRAGERFADGKDEEAKLFRGLSQELAKRGRDCRQRQTLMEEHLRLGHPAPEVVADEG